jgi:mycothiol synthase
LAEGAHPAERIVSEALTDAEVEMWRARGFALVFEELVMERDLSDPIAPARWPEGVGVLEWGPDAAAASFAVYEAAFRERPGFPGWTRAEWQDRFTTGDDFLAAASYCALVDGIPAGFVVCDRAWIDQVGVVPTFRRRGLASALVTEASARMRALGCPHARLHVNVNNPAALAAWRALGWREVGRRGRFERKSTPG